jgi:uncharacterized protein
VQIEGLEVKLEGRTIVITGAASGIGRALLEQVQGLPGVSILAVDLDPSSIREIPGRVWVRGVDISQAQNIDDLLDTARTLLGPIDLFFANAGFAYYGFYEDDQWESIERIYATNVMAPIYTFQKLRSLQGERPFRLVATASAMGFLPIPGYALYAATKASLVSFVQGLRFELDDPRMFTLVYPIATRTRFFKTGAPTPWPSQSSEHVAKAMLAAIRADRKDVFPSKVFRLTLLLNRLCPLVGWLYQKQQLWALRRWGRRRDNKPDDHSQAA